MFRFQWAGRFKLQFCSVLHHTYFEHLLCVRQYGIRDTNRRRQWHPLQYSCLENPMAAVHGVAKSWTQLSDRLYFHFSLSCTGEGNGNPLQCSCLENPRDGGAGWAAVSGVAQSQTRLKRLSSSSSSSRDTNRKKTQCLFS